ncbi:UPF0280 family protein [Nitratireductor mangrovi]|uniref:UPF0280 family protein n=1 Tax=Nitratireductor mangrovi TaxID=2599600 RepID=A0A5B8L3D8_9HYPH|nr:UPF0280 family protein [Nitratireductor mangrovi]QDZ02414.1 UPF0280 family protein [Nitratireductor mangrovi]
MNGPQIAWLADGKRLHLNHGPIDLIMRAFGPVEEVDAAYRQAARRFRTILGELVGELGELRRPVQPVVRIFSGSTARRMEAAACRHASRFVTPMAAVAGAVADEMLAALVEGRTLERAFVNNGGDIAIHLAPGEALDLAIAGTGHGISDRVRVAANEPVRGIATSGWRGRSHSLGIADAVTVLARDAASADVAATLIANAVDLPGHPAISRRPARELAPDSDLGERLVTTGVGDLTATDANEALERGRDVAEDFRRRGLIVSAALFLAGEARLCGELADLPIRFLQEELLHA